MIHGANWDNSVVMASVDEPQNAARTMKHQDIVTCLAFSNDGRHLITGSRDATLIVWELDRADLKQQGGGGLLSSIFGGSRVPLPRMEFKYSLRLHDTEVTCCDISSELGLCASGSSDGTAILYNLQNGILVANLVYDEEDSLSPLRVITLIKIVNSSKIISYCGERQVLYLHAADGTLLFKINEQTLVNSYADKEQKEEDAMATPVGPTSQQQLQQLQQQTNNMSSSIPPSAMTDAEVYLGEDNERVMGFIKTMVVTSDGRYMIAGRNDGRVCIWGIEDTQLILKDCVRLEAPVASLGLLSDGRYLLVGLKNGFLKVYPLFL
jgi:WD40 repeat protein